MKNDTLKKELLSMLAAAKANLAKYEASNDAQAVSAGKLMVSMFEQEIAALGQVNDMNAPEMFPIQTQSWRIMTLSDRGHLYPKAGDWLQCYSSLLARWCNIKYLGDTKGTEDE